MIHAPVNTPPIGLISGKIVCLGFGLYYFLSWATSILFFMHYPELKYLSSSELKLYPEILRLWLVISALSGFCGVVLCALMIGNDTRKEIFSSATQANRLSFLIGMRALLIAAPLSIAIGETLSYGLKIFFDYDVHAQLVAEFIHAVQTLPYGLLTTVVLVGIIVPFTEEFLFRGLFQNWIQTKLKNLKTAIIITSLFFSFAHFDFNQVISNIPLLTSIFVLSCFLGFLYQRKKSLSAPIALHSSFNVFQLILIYFIG